MAKSKTTQEDILLAKQELLLLDQQFNSLNKISKEYTKLLQLKEKGKAYDEERLKVLDEEFGSVDKLDKKIGSISNSYNKLSEKVNSFNKSIKESLEDFDELDSSLMSFANGIGKLPGVYDKLEQKIKATKATMSGISDILQDQNTLLSDEQVAAVTAAANAYKGITSQVANAQKHLQKGKNYTITI